jgi:hypothetical protein
LVLNVPGQFSLPASILGCRRHRDFDLSQSRYGMMAFEGFAGRTIECIGPLLECLATA